MTPNCALRMHGAIAKSEVAIFPTSSHTPFYEEPGPYFERLLEFLRAHPGALGRIHGIDRTHIAGSIDPVNPATIYKVEQIHAVDLFRLRFRQ